MRSYALPSVSSLFLLGIALASGGCGEDNDVQDDAIDGNVDGGKPDGGTPDGGKPDGSIDAGVDASKNALDGGKLADATVVLKPDVMCSLGQRYKYEAVGGNAQYTDHKELTADGEYRRVRVAVRDVDAGMLSCSLALPVCGGMGVDAADLAGALNDTVVLAAFGDGSKVYGLDPRPFDGQVLSVERQDGKKILIGSACDSQSGCVEAPAALKTLQRLLGELDTQQSQSAACSAFR